MTHQHFIGQLAW